MPAENLREQSLDDLIAKVQGLSAMAAQSEMRSIMAIFARCTIEIADPARQLSEDVNHAKTVLGERLTELTDQMKASTAQASVDMLGAKESVIPVLAEFVSELERTRISIDNASTSASKSSDALVKWTRALVFATVVYVLIAAGLFYLQWRSPSGSSSGASSQTMGTGRLGMPSGAR